MTDIDVNNNNPIIIQCPRCKTSLTVEQLGEHVNANREIKKQAIEEELQVWGEAAYDREFLILNVVFCPKCNKVSHFDDWASNKK
jgi:phage FluMu protein Com